MSVGAVSGTGPRRRGHERRSTLREPHRPLGRLLVSRRALTPSIHFADVGSTTRDEHSGGSTNSERAVWLAFLPAHLHHTPLSLPRRTSARGHDCGA